MHYVLKAREGDLKHAAIAWLLRSYISNRVCKSRRYGKQLRRMAERALKQRWQ